MPIATTTALLIGAGISAGTQAYGAHKAASAAKEAAKTEAGAAQAAQDKLAPIMAPYVNTGAQAMTTLGGLMGLGGGGPMGGPPAAGAAPLVPPQNPYTARGLTGPQAGTQGAAPPGYTGDYRSQHAPTSDPQQAAMQQSQSSYSGQNGAPQLVRVQSPDGEVRMVPQQQADFFKSRGATILGA